MVKSKNKTARGKGRKIKLRKRESIYQDFDDILREQMKIDMPKVCITCNKWLDVFHPQDNPYGLQVGHYISRTRLATRWQRRNCHWQCARCNFLHEQNPVPYTKFMLRNYKIQGIEKLDQMSKKQVIISVAELQSFLVIIRNNPLLLESFLLPYLYEREQP